MGGLGSTATPQGARRRLLLGPGHRLRQMECLSLHRVWRWAGTPWRGSSGQRPTWAPEQKLELRPSSPQRGTSTHPAVLSPVWAQEPDYSPYSLLIIQTASHTLTAPTPLNTQLTAPHTTHSPDTSTDTVTPHTNTFLTSNCRRYTAPHASKHNRHVPTYTGICNPST